jgi:transposase
MDVESGISLMMRPANELPAVCLCRDTADLRKGINGQAILVEEALQHDPFSGRLFVFCNRRRGQRSMTTRWYSRFYGVKMPGYSHCLQANRC